MKGDIYNVPLWIIAIGTIILVLIVGAFTYSYLINKDVRLSAAEPPNPYNVCSRELNNNIIVCDLSYQICVSDAQFNYELCIAQGTPPAECRLRLDQARAECAENRQFCRDTARGIYQLCIGEIEKSD